MSDEQQAAANRAAEQERANQTAREGLAAAEAERARKEADEALRRQGR
jgi:hypothetical protein